MNQVFSASAGTGKTHQVTEHYLNQILQHQQDPRTILLMTFTENAAAELRERITTQLYKALQQPDQDQHHIQTTLTQLESAPITTIHGFCTTLLREYALDASLSPTFTILADDQQTNWLETLAHNLLIEHLNTDPDFATFAKGRQLASFGQHGTSIPQTAIALIHTAGSLGYTLTHPEQLLEPALPPQPIQVFHTCLQSFDQLPSLTPTQKKIQSQLSELLEQATTTEQLISRIQAQGFKVNRRTKGPPIELADLIEQSQTRIQYQQKRPFALGFARYVTTLYQHYEQLKATHDKLDFDDLQRKALQLIQNRHLPLHFNTIIIDEVQDTSRIQARLIQALWKKNTHLIICGDPKQSIYSWRGADPSIMPHLQDQIIQQGGPPPTHLQTSWRSKEALLNPINQLFNTLLNNYEPNESLQPNPQYAHAEESHGIECLLPESDECPKKERIEQQMQALATRINLLINGDTTWQPNYRYQNGFVATSDQNQYRYSDILILQRTTKHQPELEAALRKAHIPYTLAGKGRGLFTTSPARDLSLLLTTLCEPNDLYSLIGFLRSPWIGLSDLHITTQLMHKKNIQPDDVLSAFPAAKEKIETTRQHLATQLPSEIVRDWISHTHYEALLSTHAQPEQQRANLRKLLDWIREEERGWQTTPGTLARKLKNNIQNPPQTAEATSADPEQNAVTLMSIHSSKGLTHRVVCLPDISFSPKADTHFAHLSEKNNQLQLALCITEPDRSKTYSPSLKSGREHAKQISQQERHHLLYVALTRARDLLILSSADREKPNEWHKQIAPLLENPIRVHTFPELQQHAQLIPVQAPSVPTANQLEKSFTKHQPPTHNPTFQRTTTTATITLDTPAQKTSPQLQDVHKTTSHLGTFGHALLEEAARQCWQLNIHPVAQRIRQHLHLTEKEIQPLLCQLPSVIEHMQQQTQHASSLLPEHSFLLHTDQHLIDGTIDLVAIYPDGIHLFDYKFSQSTPQQLKERYQPQLHIYGQALRNIYPNQPILGSHIVAIQPNHIQSIPLP